MQGSSGSGIAVVGGEDRIGTAIVQGNQAQLDLRTNTADGIVCEDGVTGNTATCTFEDNVDTSANALLSRSVRAADRVGTLTRPVTAVLVERLNAQIVRLQEREQALRIRAESITDVQLQKRLRQLCDKLSALQVKLAARRDGRSPWEEHLSIDSEPVPQRSTRS